MATLNKVKENRILKNHSEFMNGSDIAEYICKGVIIDLSKEIPIIRILTEDEPIREESENESFKSMSNINIKNNVKKKTNWKRTKKGICDDI